MSSTRVPSPLGRHFSGPGIAPVFAVLLGLLVGVAATASPAHAQSRRAGGVFYGKVGAGISDYTGDLPLSTETAFFDLREFTRGSGFPYIFSGEAGYQYLPELGVAFALQGGNHPVLTSTGSSLSDSHLLTVQLLGRYTFQAQHWTVAPYLDGGAGITVGGNADTPGFGPVLGAGVDVRINRFMSFYLESRFNLTFPDDAVDGAEPFSGPFDVAGQLLGAGLKVDITRPPVAPTIRSVEGPEKIRAGRTATFTARVNGAKAARPLTYRWQFGDGDSEPGLTVSHTYDQPGEYRVTFTARNEAGVARRSLTVTATPPPDAPTEPVEEVAVQAPEVIALERITRLRVGELITFRGQINEEATRPLTYRWHFGDGESESGRTASHRYDQPGTYEVTFIARNEAGQARRSMRVIVVQERLLPARIASISATPNPAPPGKSIRFRSIVQGAPPLEYEWHFGDGSSATGSSPRHTYEEPGQYTVRLEAFNDVDEDAYTITVRVK